MIEVNKESKSEANRVYCVTSRGNEAIQIRRREKKTS